MDATWLGLIAYVVITGLRSTVLKGLQIHGAANPIGGDNPISFCNVFLISQLMVALALISLDRNRLRSDLQRMNPAARRWIVLDSFLGCFLAPMAFFLALEHLSVINQTLLFSLTLPASAVVARCWLRERLPKCFWWSSALIAAGLLLGKWLAPAAMGGDQAMGQLIGVAWALLSVSAAAVRSSVRRKLLAYTLCRGVASGIPNLAGAVVFALIALQQYGPEHFFYLSLWWVLGVIVVYGLTICLGAEVFRLFAQRHFQVAQVGLAGSAALVVTVLSAALFLQEPIAPATVVSLLLVLAGVSLRFVLPERGAS